MLFSTAVKAVVVARLVILDISPLTSFILALRAVLVTKLVISGILSLMLLISALYAYFLTTSFFTKLVSLLKSTGVVFNFLISNLSTSLYLLYLLHQEQSLIYQHLIYLLQILLLI